jgi:hypothetical protein
MSLLEKTSIKELVKLSLKFFVIFISVFGPSKTNNFLLDIE